VTKHTPEPPAIACTLAPADFESRLAEIAELNSAALLAHRRDLRLEIIYAATARARVVGMFRGEQACCGFLTFDIRAEKGGIRVVIEAPEAARATAESVFEPFRSKTLRQTGCGCCRGES
jgi:hypothetical protein